MEVMRGGWGPTDPAQVSLGSARTRVLVYPGQAQVLGYYALAPHDTYREDLPGATAGGLRVVPGYLIAQLATSCG